MKMEPLHAGPPSSIDDSPPAGSPPLHRYTPPAARVQSRHRPVSWLAGLRRFPPSRLAAMAFREPTIAPGLYPGVAAHSCGGSSLAAGMTRQSGFPVSALAGHRRLDP